MDKSSGIAACVVLFMLGCASHTQVREEPSMAPIVVEVPLKQERAADPLEVSVIVQSRERLNLRIRTAEGEEEESYASLELLNDRLQGLRDLALEGRRFQSLTIGARPGLLWRIVSAVSREVEKHTEGLVFREAPEETVAPEALIPVPTPAGQ